VSRRYRFERMTRARGIQFKEAAWEIMEQAYNKASGNGDYPANARQIMYAARPYIQQRVGKPLQSSYFTQTLLPNYIEGHGAIIGPRLTMHEATLLSRMAARGSASAPLKFGITCAVSVTRHSLTPR
jgi:hypothetical protein